MKLQLNAGNPAVKSRKTTFWGAIIMFIVLITLTVFITVFIIDE